LVGFNVVGEGGGTFLEGELGVELLLELRVLGGYYGNFIVLKLTLLILVLIFKLEVIKVSLQVS
jgi:hypothetical protein